MFTSVALVAALAFTPAQAGLTLSGARVTYGELGATRTDLRFLPGDIFFVAFDVDGIKIDDTGRVKYSMGMEVVNKDGASIFKEQPREREDFLPLGGTKLPARAFVTIGPDQAPGIYTCRVTVVDRAAKSTKTIEQKFEVVPKTFGIVQVVTSSDEKGALPAPPVGVAGQQIYVHFAVIGFARDPKTKQPNFDVEMAVFTKDGAATVKKPVVETTDKDVGANDTAVPFVLPMPFNRAGDFTFELKATDKVSKATAKVSIPVKVLPIGN